MHHVYRPLVLGSGIAFVASLLFSVIAFNALEGGPLVALDEMIAREMRKSSSEHSILRAFMIAVTHSGGVAAMTILATLGVIWQGWRGRGKARVALAWAVIVATGGVLNLVLKESFQRERPPKEWRDPAISETNKSFPSGHAMGGTVGIGLLGYAPCAKSGAGVPNSLSSSASAPGRWPSA